MKTNIKELYTVTTADVYFGFSTIFAKNIFRLIGCSSCIQKKDILKYPFCYLKTYGGSTWPGLCTASTIQPALQKLKKGSTSLLQTQKVILSNC